VGTKRRRRLISVAATVLGIVIAWNAVAVQAEVVVLRKIIRDPKVVYVIEDARPFTFWLLGDTGCTVVTRVDMAKTSPGGNFFTPGGRPITYVSLDGVHPTGWGTFVVEAGWQWGGLAGEGGEHIVVWDLAGWHYRGYTVTWGS
jgi:hypothetical protein